MLHIHQTRKSRKVSLEESIAKALTASQDVKIPDGPIIIDRDLLQDIRDTLYFVGRDEGYYHCAGLCDKLDSLYPFLNKQ